MLKSKKYVISLLAIVLSISLVNSKMVLAKSESSAESHNGAGKIEEDKNGVKWSYETNPDGTVSIWQNGDLSGEIEIPEKLEGFTVSGIKQYGLSRCETITSVKIPTTIKSIGESAFFGCTSLSNIQIPSSVTNIEDAAFEKTPWLTKQRKSNPLVVVNNILIDGKDAAGDIVIPSNVTAIGGRAFAKITLEHYYRYGKPYEVKSVVIPEGVKTIGEGAFFGCNNLRNIKIPSSVSKIGKYAFNGTAWLSSLRGSNKFIVVNNILISVGDNITGHVIIPSNVVTIGGEAFRGADKVTSVEIPSSVKEIGEDAFSQCTNLSKISIPDSVINIDNGAFDMCYKLDNVKLPRNIKSIKPFVFQSCKNLTRIDIPSGVTEIDNSAFSFCYALQKVRIPKSVINIHEDAFEDCNNLMAAYCEENSYSSKYFKNKGIKVKDYNKYSDNNSDIQAGATGIATDRNNIKWRYTQLSDDTLSISVVGESVSGGIEIPAQLNGHVVSTIEEKALWDCKITSVKIPEGVKIISDSAFRSNGQLTSVEIPLSVTYIGSHAFYDCRGLSSVTIPNKAVTLGKNAFPTNTKVYIGTSNVTNSVSQISPSQVNNSPVGSSVPQGWHKDGEHWYWSWSDGSKRNGWYDENGKRYYFYGNGQMATEFIDLNGYSYYFQQNPDGKAPMVTGWKYINGNWFYFNPDPSGGLYGFMKRACWAYIDGRWYYFYYNGTMAHNTYIDGYYVNSSGAWVN